MFYTMFSKVNAQNVVNCTRDWADSIPQQAQLSGTYDSIYGKQSFHIPTLNDPVITVNVVFHIFMPTQQPNPLTAPIYTPFATSPYNSLQQLKSLFDGSADNSGNSVEAFDGNSDRYSAPCSTSYNYANPPSNINNGDSRVQFELVKVYFYRNDTLFGDILTNSKRAEFLNYIEQVNPGSSKEGIAVISGFTGGQDQSAYNGHLQIWRNLSAGHDSASHALYQGSDRNTLRHEFGHCFGWLHPYKRQNVPPNQVDGQHESLNCNNPDFLSDFIFSNNAVNCAAKPSYGACLNTVQNNDPACGGVCLECESFGTNNVMADNAWGGCPNRRWMSPLQMGRRIRALHFFRPRQYAKEMESQHIHPWEITGTQTWNFDIQMYRDIVVKTGATLIVTSKISMAAGGKIIVEKGGRLAVKGGTITGWCEKAPAGYNSPLWKGIEIQGDLNVQHSVQNGWSPYHGVVELSANGVYKPLITRAMVGISTATTGSNGVVDHASQGGVVIAKDAVFENNEYDIIFYEYQNFISSSAVRNSTFQTTAEIGRRADNSEIKPKEHIKLFKNSHLKIEGCVFRNTYKKTPATHEGIGIYSTDSKWTLKQYCSAVGCTTGVKNRFEHLKSAIYIDNFNPLFACIVSDSKIDSCNHPIHAENCYNLTIRQNTIATDDNNNWSIDTSAFIYMYKSKYYKIHDNKLLGNFYCGGIAVYDSKEGAHEIYRNDIDSFYVNVLAMDDNGGKAFHNIGLRIFCNDFSSRPSHFDVALVEVFSPPIVMANHSSATSNNPKDWVRNLYQGWLFSAASKWYIDPSNTQGINHSNSQDGLDDPDIYPYDQTSSQLNVIEHQNPQPAFVYETHCPVYSESTGGTPSAENSTKLGNLNDYISEMRSDTSSLGRFEVQSAVSSKLSIFILDTLESSQDSVISILQSNQGGMDDADIQEVFAYMMARDYETAQEKVDLLPAVRASWISYLTHLIALETGEGGVSALSTETTEAQFFRDYAENEGGEGQASAQALLKYILNEEHSFPVVFPELPSQERRKATATNSAMEVGGISIFPNPTNGVFTIKASEKGHYSYAVYDLMGKMILNGPVPNGGCKVDLSTHPNSTYLCKIQNQMGEILIRQVLIKNQ